MSVPKSDLKVYIFSNDCNAIRNEVYKHRHSATGGNLFGLMTTSGNAVVHVALGPGQRCRRTDSFHQDEAYARRVEQFLREGHMLCLIGEWYSQPQRAGSNKSSQIIPCIFPIGMSKFLVIKANVNDQSEFEMFPYFFTRGDREERCEEAQCVVLDAVSPFSEDVKILAQIEQGAERKEFHRNESNAGASPSGLGRNTSSSGSTALTNRTSRQNSNNPPGGSSLQHQTVNSESERATATAKDLILKQIHDGLKKFFGVGDVDMELTSNEDIHMIFEHNSYHWMILFPETFPHQQAKLYRAKRRDQLSSCSPCHHYYLEKPLDNHANILWSVKNNCHIFCTICEHINKETLTNPNPNATSSGPTPMEISRTESPRSGPTSITDLPSPAGNNPRNGCSLERQNSEGETLRKIVLKEIQDDLQSFFRNEGQVETKSKSDGEMQITFKHSNKYWTLHFPKTFPNGQPAKLSRAPWPTSITTFLDNTLYLENRVNIFLSIKENCFAHCNICKNFTKEKLTKPATTTGNTNLADTIMALENEIKMIMATPQTFAGKAQDDGSYKIEFEHYYKKWSILLPTEFPDKPAEVYKEESSYKNPEKQTIRDSSRSRHEEKPLISSELVMFAVRSNCFCSQCFRMKKI